MISLLKKYPLTATVVAVIIYLSLILNPNRIEIPSVEFADKWAHIVMYLGFSAVVWFEYWKNAHGEVRILTAWISGGIFPALFGGLMELGQKYLTTYRGADWLDALANAVGAFLASAIATSVVCAWKRKHSAR